MAADYRDTQDYRDTAAASGAAGSAPPGDNGLRAVPDLLAGLIREAGELFRTEGQLVRAELSDKMRQAQVGGGSIAAGAICLLVSLFVLSQALVVALGKYIDTAWAALAVGVLFAVIGAILLMKGKKDLEPTSLTPDRTVRQLGKDTELVKDQTR
ncbi:phage holin family protein [Antarcticirhabdus aurantiaca]|uniref:Phage holin family protein n=1 Tax=Antarcticirhabdus aurantiaca TaxID=2606717 RepID=A0ACD4NPT3_9HYPH|nr:phage holin family protein [Antarcticirhabdus aurantiaca]WAJ28975.1 phage holin family protein [Jeongeuplla avenae]